MVSHTAIFGPKKSRPQYISAQKIYFDALDKLEIAR
jgi:hypothetical protein